MQRMSLAVTCFPALWPPRQAQAIFCQLDKKDASAVLLPNFFLADTNLSTLCEVTEETLLP